jgi:hypothetical protein
VPLHGQPHAHFTSSFTVLTRILGAVPALSPSLAPLRVHLHRVNIFAAPMTTIRIADAPIIAQQQNVLDRVRIEMTGRRVLQARHGDRLVAGIQDPASRLSGWLGLENRTVRRAVEERRGAGQRDARRVAAGRSELEHKLLALDRFLGGSASRRQP